MPQLDIFSYNLQCFLLTIFFFYFFYFFYNNILIQLLKLFKIRIFINLYINNLKKNIKNIFIKYNFFMYNKINILFKNFYNYIIWFNFLNKYKRSNICLLL